MVCSETRIIKRPRLVTSLPAHSEEGLSQVPRKFHIDSMSGSALPGVKVVIGHDGFWADTNGVADLATTD